MTDDCASRGPGDPDASEHYPGQEPCDRDQGDEHTTNDKEQQQ